MNQPKRKSDINALLAEIKARYDAIENLYHDSLAKKEIDLSLKIKVKNYLENARSVLDYCAHDIADVLGITAKQIYFPIVGKDKDVNSFEGSIGRNLPRLKSRNQKVFDYLESIQPYHLDYAWLSDFAITTSDIKHVQLTPQIKTEIKTINIEHKGTGMRLSGGASINMGPGTSISLGGAVIPGGQVISPDSSLIFGDPRLNVKKEIWVDFRFNDSISALPLLKNINDNLSTIVDEVYKLI